MKIVHHQIIDLKVNIENIWSMKSEAWKSQFWGIAIFQNWYFINGLIEAICLQIVNVIILID